MSYQTIRGKILYTSLKPERINQERGREYFSLTVQQDETRVLHAHCEIDDEPAVIRDITLAFDKNNYPLDCFNRITVGHKFEGTGWFRFTDDMAECETYNQRDGRIRQQIPLTAPIRWLGSHPIVADGLACKVYDRSAGLGKQLFSDMALTSPDHRGATGPMLFRLRYGIEFLGEKTITVPAGTFECYHFGYTDTAEGLPEEHPTYEVWCTKDHFIAVAAEAGGYMQTRYELVEYSVD